MPSLPGGTAMSLAMSAKYLLAPQLTPLMPTPAQGTRTLARAADRGPVSGRRKTPCEVAAKTYPAATSNVSVWMEDLSSSVCPASV
ncbi:hypothetical protein [Streptomyces sp. CoH27]|uniref:hypothetical protein n=1 Tax=Streptomyces sp. CoH27 TaxID=2875763 RepID=UPI001CD55B22|nr:hypothetical protein [Streptomyces sp. CoH27]